MTHLSPAHFNSHLWKSLRVRIKRQQCVASVPALAQRNTSWLTEDAFIAGIYLFSTLSGKTVTFQLGAIVASQWVWAWPRRTSLWRRCSPIRPSVVLMRSRPKTSSRTAGLTRRTRRDLSACTSRWPWDWRRSPRSRARTDPRHNTQPQVCPRALWSPCNAATITQQPLNY